MLDMQFDKTVCKYLKQRVFGTINQEETQELKVSDAMPDIGRVLCAWGQPIVRGKEWRSNAMSVTGGVMASVLYAPEDGTEPRRLETWIPFQLNWDFPESQRDGTIRVLCRMKSLDARSLSARKIMLRATVVAAGEGLEPTEEMIYESTQLFEDIQLLNRSYPMMLPKESGEKTFLLDEELTVPAGNTAPQKLMRYSIQTEVQDRKVVGSKIVFRGISVLHVLYGDSEGKLQSHDFEIPFSQFSDLEQEYEQNAQTNIWMAVTSLELENEEDGKLRLKCGLLAQYVIYARTLITVSQDAYSPHREVTIHMEPLHIPMHLDTQTAKVTAAQTIPVDAANVVDLSFLSDFPKWNRIGEMVHFEVQGVFQCLYYDENGSAQTASARSEATWDLCASDSCDTTCITYPLGSPRMVPGNGSIAVESDVFAEMDAASEEPIGMITGISCGELQEPDPARPSIVLRRVGQQDTMWGIAKQYGSTMEAIQQANHMQNEQMDARILLIPVL